MATGTDNTTVARESHEQQVHYLRKSVTYSDDGTAVTVGVLPAGATILKPLSGVNVDTAFDAGTTNTLNIGTSGDDNLYGTLLAVGSIAFVPLDEAVAMTVSAVTTITATVVLTGTAATAGAGEVIIAYIPDGDG
jgi:hypothetical protein